MFLTKFSGWEKATAKEYAQCYDNFGGNFSTHPALLELLHKGADCHEVFYLHRNRDGQFAGAVCVWGGKTIANDITTIKITDHLALPIPRDELILPFSPALRAFLPFKSKIISEVNFPNIINVSQKLNSGRSISLAKNTAECSSKSSGNRKRELKKFLTQGGEIRDQSEFSASELMNLYASLFEKRRGVSLQNIEGNIAFLQAMREHIFGKVMFFAGEPCAYQLIFKSESRDVIAFDYINIGLDPKFKVYSPGTILKWLNINAAQELCEAQQKKLRYSFGRPTAAYKEMWCHGFPLGRLITL